MKRGTVLSLNISDVRGVEKNCVPEVEIVEGWGVKDDAHGGDWDAQVSIFPVEAIAKVPPEKWDEVNNGGYTENVTISGIDLDELTPGRTVQLGPQAQVRIHHVGKQQYKEFHRHYIVSREGRFCVVVKGGRIKVGDEVKLL